MRERLRFAAYDRAAGLPLLPGIARAEFWLAIAARAVVSVWMVVSWFTPGRPGARSLVEAINVRPA